MISFWQVLLSALFVLLTWMFNKVKTIYNRLNKKNERVPDVEVLKKIVPLSKDSGWKVSVVKNGVPIWKYQTTFSFAPVNLYGCRALLQGKPEAILNELLNVKTFCSLFPNLSPLKLQKKELNKPFVNGDVLSISNINTSLSLTSIITSHHSIFTLDRYWFKDGSSTWLYMCPTSSLLSNEYGYWIAFFIHELNHKACLLHVLASYPGFTNFSYVSEMLSSCLVLARENMDSMQLQKMQKQVGDMRDVVSPPRNPPTPVQPASPQSKTKSPRTPKNNLGEEAVGQVEGPAVINHIQTPTNEHKENVNIQENNENAVVDVNRDDAKKKEPKKLVKKIQADPKLKFAYDEALNPYASLLEETFKKLYDIFQADANTPGWHEMGVKDGIQLFKKDGDEQSVSGTYKGVSTINVPLPYLLSYTHNLDYRTEFDAIYESGVEIVCFKDGITKINNLLYQNVWPTTGRDFCSIAALRHLKDNIYGSAVRAIVHPECPERRNKVRGEILIGGYVFEELSTDPPSVRMTYITRVELKGSIPQRIINRVNADQPLIAGIIKKHVERRYEIRDPDTDGMDIMRKVQAVPSVFEEPPSGEMEQTEPDVKSTAGDRLEEKADDTAEVPDKSETLGDDTKKDNIGDTEDTATTDDTGLTDETTHENFVLKNGFDLREQHYGKNPDDEDGVTLPRRMTSDDSLINDSVSVSNLSQVEFTEDQTQVSICEQPLDLPRDANGKIDYITLGNQAAAALEEEFIVARSVTSSSNNEDKFSDVSGTWIYQGTSKDVEILRKISPGQKFHSFLGRGIINALPVTVWEAIKNPTTRFIYDNMLKKNVILKEISDRHRILHMRHETTACFVKQARDFCLLTVERVEQQRYTLVGTSVEIPECPPVRDCVRGRILSSGWVVEPILYNGRYCSKVTYITQVDFGGRLPTRVINFIAKRQPLSLAYLRDYLESAEF